MISVLGARKVLLPAAAALLMAGNVACNNNKVQHQADRKSTEVAIDFTKRGMGEEVVNEDFGSLVDVKSLDKIQSENNKDTEYAWKNFKVNGQNNTKLDSIAMFDMAIDNIETTQAIDFLKARAALENLNNITADNVAIIEPEVKQQIDNYITNPDVQKLYNNYMSENDARKAAELLGNL